MSILQKLQSNDITTLCIKQEAEEICEDLYRIIDALQNNKSVESIVFEERFLGDLRNDDRASVLEAIGLIPTLRKVHLGDSLLTVNGITKMLCEAQSLCELTLSSLLLQGVESEFNSLEAALYQHPSLKYFKMDDCRTAVASISLENLNQSSDKLGVPIAGSRVPNKNAAQSA